MNDDQRELANAYLDGEVTADERALVDADAALLDEVARLRVVRAALGDVDPPDAVVRESAIAAALAEFTRGPADGPSVAAPNVTPIEKRRRMRRMQTLSAAAATILIVGGGIVISQRGTGDRDSETAVQQDSRPVVRAPSLTQPTNVDAAADDESATTNDAPMMAAAPSLPVSDAEAVSETSASSAEMEADSDSGVVGPAPPAPTTTTPFVGDAGPQVVVVRDAGDLLELAESMKVAPINADEADRACVEGTLKADALYEAPDGSQQVIVVVTFGDDDDGALGALSLDDCEIVLPVDAAID